MKRKRFCNNALQKLLLITNIFGILSIFFKKKILLIEFFIIKYVDSAYHDNPHQHQGKTFLHVYHVLELKFIITL